MIDKGICDKRFISNPSNCECEYYKSCNVGEYLDYENCKCRKKLVNKLIEECTKNGEETKITGKLYLNIKISVNLYSQFLLS